MTTPTDQVIHSLRLIVAGASVGPVALAGAVHLVRKTLTIENAASLERPLLGLLALALVSSALGYALLQRALSRDLAARRDELRQSDDPASGALASYRRFVIAASGLIEAPAFLAGVVYLLTDRALTLLVVAGAVLLLLSRLPSRDALDRLVERATHP